VRQSWKTSPSVLLSIQRYAQNIRLTGGMDKGKVEAAIQQEQRVRGWRYQNAVAILKSEVILQRIKSSEWTLSFIGVISYL